MRGLFTIRNISFLISLTLAVGLVGFILLQNLAPFGITVHYDLQNKSKYLSGLNPKDRIKEETQNGKTIYRQIADLIYFSTDMPFHFDTATIRMKVKNATENQAIKVGFKDQLDWHYATKTVDLPILTLSNWHAVGNDPVLYQKEKRYTSTNDFFKNPPKDALVGVYDYDINKLMKTRLENYVPQKKDTIITTPFRGRVTLYTYLQNEPFTMSVTKQDLNWYEEPDPVNISIYKEGTQVYEATIDDDGITDSSKKITQEQTVTIKNPGPGLPETGMYKVVIGAGQDTIIKQIKTNLHKIVFESPLFLAGNASVYPKVIKHTQPTTVYTDALLLNIQTYHTEGLQKIKTPKKTLRLNEIKVEGQIVPEEKITPVTIPENDVIVKSFAGFFAFNQSQYFQPIKYHTLQITQQVEIDLVNYILTSKKPAQQDGEWRIVEQTYDLSDAIINDGKLSWLIQAPKLAVNKNTVTIGNIEVLLHKKPTIKL